MKLYAAFSNGSLDPDMKQSLVLGPFDPEYIELTYNGLRVAPDGDHIAIFDTDDGYWHIISGTACIDKTETVRQIGQWHEPIIGDTCYSDIDIYWRES